MMFLNKSGSPSQENQKFLSISKGHENLIQEFLDNCERTNKSHHTINNYKTDLVNFLKWWHLIETVPLFKISSQHISEYLKFLSAQEEYLKKWKNTDYFWNWFTKNFLWEDGQPRQKMKRPKKLKIATQKRHLSALKVFFNFLIESDSKECKKFTQNPIKTTLHQLKLKEVDVEHTPTLTRDEWNQLEENIIDVPGRLTIFLLYYGGLRLAELSKLRYSDFRPEDGSIRLVRKGGKVHQLRVYKNWPEIEDLLHKQKNRNKNNKIFIFPGQNNGPLSERAMYQRIIKILRKGECLRNKTPHSFRKALATELYRLTKDLLLVRDYLNHSDAKVTQTYIDNQLLMNERQEKGTSCFLQ